MDLLCPDLDDLVSCHSCGQQSLPPYRLCKGAWPVCPPCRRYKRRCACGHLFTSGQHSIFDWAVTAMRLRCKYRDVVSPPPPPPDAVGCDRQKRYGVQELWEHYRTGCTKNGYPCPLYRCGHLGRVDTIVEHYEAAHGPFITLGPSVIDTDNNAWRRHHQYEVAFKISLPSGMETEVVHKIFNGYFLFAAKQNSVSLNNINPSDPLRYNYKASTVTESSQLVYSGIIFIDA